MNNKYARLTKEILQEDYNIFGNFKLIAEKYNIPRSTIERYCKILEVKTTAKIIYNVDHNIFSYNNEHSFYLAGLIAADGCINRHKSKVPNSITLCLSKKDEDFLIKIKDALKFSGPINHTTSHLSKYNNKWNDSEQSRFTIYSKYMIHDLERFDIGQRKSLTYQFPDWLMDHSLVSHFMRGYCDGDGSFYISKDYRITKKFGTREYCKFVFSLRGTKSFLEAFALILWERANIQSITKPKFNNGIYQLKYAGNNQVRKISKYLYFDANIYLERKYNIIKDLL